MNGWVWVRAREDVSKWPEMDPQECHRGVLGQRGQSNNCLPSLAVSFCTDLKDQSPSCSTLTPPTQAIRSLNIFFCRGGSYFSFFRDRETGA